MNRYFTFSLMACLGGFLWACQTSAPVTSPLDDAGFTSLFNGQDLDNWDLKIRSGDSAEAAKVFHVEDGMVHIFGQHPDSFMLNDGQNLTHGLMYTRESYSRYRFSFEYKWGTKIANNFDQFQYDAGMYYHVFDDKIWPFGLEYQVRYNHLTDQNHTGDYWASKARMQWTSADSGKTFMLPSEGGMPQTQRGGEHRAKADAPFHGLDGEWNRCEVIVMDSTYSIHILNGEIVNMATELSHGSGIIGLQSETAEIFYRNIKIQEYPEFIPAKAFLEALK
ncbi:DUF1080 domain-containing protein [Pontibacter sp. G13]|uniref:3-keto-disaccharide hydrolase n=1 Tax=Pontibacter sp. G13 TaxID=3074898 RepID=UPI002888FC09|nr:DUF1080 domain-containing protein [Pontibacter sp. G13]WNJ18442.1 DUF1080 domain-containing protein [Pontibacter sp. G13]